MEVDAATGTVIHRQKMHAMIGALGLASFLTITRAVSGRDDPRVTAFFGLSIGVGWLVFGAVPDAWSLFGMSVIGATGVAMLLRR